ncbi:pilus assembly protein TadG-related protein [Falsiroseomonas oryzae]|uniref:pilus assembly protein TadG-related protein n=1 Tax=Falsiroseomonas oryzae TaxID=2766473 RepID=UPI0022EB58DF|nr:pilus assembly protein TadG-related protein [Roseomonas sp. MO-31]
MTVATIHDRLVRLRRDRRGVTSAAFAGAGVVLFGAVAMATDVGVWYAARRDAQSAADAAAIAGALTLPRATATQARNSALDLAARNGFAHAGATTVAVNIPPMAGPRRTDPNAVEVVVRQQQTMGAAGMFLSSPPTVQARAVGTLRDDRPVCLLALTDGISLGGSAAISAPDCAVASNRRSGDGFSISGSASLAAYTVSAVTTCDGCDRAALRVTEPYKEWQFAATNPYAALDTKLLPRFNGSSCLNPSGQATLEPYETNGGRAYCQDIRLNAGETLTLRPGTYYLSNASLRINGGATLRCSGCTGGQGVTIVLTGNPNTVGEIDVNSAATVELNAPANPADPDWRGILFYRDVRASTGGTAVRLNGGAGLRLAGGMYFPSSVVQFTGSSGMTGCTVLVAAALDFRGNASAAVSSCALTGTQTPVTRRVAVVE